MDDLMYRYNNQNSIYVLNSSFNSYGEFGRLNLIACPQLNPAITNDDRSANCPESQLSALTSNSNNNNNSNSNGCSSVTRSLQHKLKTLGSLSSGAAEGNGNSGGASSMSLSSTAASSAGTCSPAAAALQKLFNCTSVASNINSCNNSGNNNSNSSSSSCNMGSNSSNSNIMRDCLTATETDAMRDSGAMLSNNSNNNNNTSNSNGSSSSGNNNNNNSNTNNKKKCANVKSTLIAKKTKFLKYLEEEKWRAHDDSIENLSTTNCERNRGDSNNMYSNSTALRGSSTAYNAILTSSASSTTGGSFQHNNNSSNTSSSSNHYGSNIAAAVNTTVATSSSQQQQQQPPQHQQYKSNNWSGNHDSNNQKQQKTSSELYKEAAELLGLSCTLCDNCRCLDCQSGYFDCDDSDSYSELSFMDEYEEVGTAPTTTSVFMMHADYEYEDDTEQQNTEYTQQQLHQQQQQEEEHAGQQHFLHCNGTDCNNENSARNAGNIKEETTNEATTMLAVAINDGLTVNISLTDNEMSNVDRCEETLNSGMMMPSNSSSITTQPLLTAPLATKATTATAAATSTVKAQHQLNELEHCASFNELSLMDARRRDKTHDCLWAEQQQQQQQQHVSCGSK